LTNNYSNSRQYSFNGNKSNILKNSQKIITEKSAEQIIEVEGKCINQKTMFNFNKSTVKDANESMVNFDNNTENSIIDRSCGGDTPSLYQPVL
jgi:hypothetical protein